MALMSRECSRFVAPPNDCCVNSTVIASAACGRSSKLRKLGPLKAETASDVATGASRLSADGRGAVRPMTLTRSGMGMANLLRSPP